ncbi:hypothetical protein SVAN01_09827 [Stagonosporopsis vannaccii]|nr:hypothetical protein SVAN01_09827 [Stagonosporopsis vannaccii]
MCWISLTPTKTKRKPTPSDCSSADIVRVRHNPKRRFSDISIALPSTVTSPTSHHQQHHHGGLHLHPHLPEHLRPPAPLPHGLLHHHHRHPHLHGLHPLHLHPVTPLHGAGKKLRFDADSAAPPPPPSSLSSSSPSSSSSSSAAPCRPREPVYRTQIVEPTAVRASTRSALRHLRAKGRVRRVGGYEVLGKNVPWDWDCVSSTVGSRSSAGGAKEGKRKRKGKGARLRYPPFGGMERWL